MMHFSLITIALLFVAFLDTRRVQLKDNDVLTVTAPKNNLPDYVNKFMRGEKDLIAFRNVIRANARGSPGSEFQAADAFNDNIIETPQRSRYKLSNGFVYTIDEFGRVKKVEGRLKRRPARTQPVSQEGRIRTTNQHYCKALANDQMVHAGHLIGHRFMDNFQGPFTNMPCRDSLNFLPMHPKFNQGNYANMESFLDDLVDQSDVYVELIIHYEKNNPRDSFFGYPSRIDVSLTPRSFCNSFLFLGPLWRSVFKVSLFNPVPSKKSIQSPIYSSNWPQDRRLTNAIK